ncbi:hypothetical protein C1645_784140 [Glomus cerebriforme]|uniref:MACPF domain-containing protein n=1 Tax=Glomus cerebriforme TaxID=658196 RepID=A0A397SFW0_9GLOM|nr:hypothetical protein C1645_784140 [Glomus cerebriforme]
MSFIGPNGEIERVTESKRSLKETLTGEKGEILKIKKPLDCQDKGEVINKYKLEYGWKIHEDRLINSEEKAFEFEKPIKNQLTIHNCYKHIYKTETYTNSSDKSRLNYFIASINATLPWSPLSVNFSVSQEHKSQTTKFEESSITYEINDHVKSIIKISKISPTVKFKQAVERALDNSNPLSELKKITEIFGEYVILEMEIGGKEISHSSKIVQQKSKTKSSGTGVKLNASNIAGGEIGISDAYKANISNSSQNASTEIIGGDENKYRKDDLNEWLADYTKWEIINYDKIEPIFNILDDKLRQKVINVIMGKKILYKGRDPIKNLKLFPNRPYRHELKIPPHLQSNLQNCQLFASITSKEKHVFSIQVIYADDNSASLLLHKISDNNKNKSERYDLQISWIIIGYPNNFNNIRDEFKIKINSSKTHSSNTIKIDQFQKHEFCLLATYAYNAPKESNNNPFESNIAAGICFCENSTLIAFTYDLKSKRQQNHKNTLLIHYR